MTKICKNCNHRKGTHKFYIVQGEVYCCCKVQLTHFKSIEDCGCNDFREKEK